MTKHKHIVRLTKSMAVAGLIASLSFEPVGAQPVGLQNATATLSQQSGWLVNAAIDGVIDNSVGWAGFSFSGTDGSGPETAVFETVANLTLGGGELLSFTLHQVNHNPQHTIGRFRLSATTDNRTTFADGMQSGGDVTANWTVLTPRSFVATGGATLSSLGDGSILAGGINPITSVYTITAETSLQNITGFRLEVLEDPSLPFNGPGRYPSNGNFVLTEFQVNVVPEPHLTMAGLTAALVFLLRRKRA